MVEMNASLELFLLMTTRKDNCEAFAQQLALPANMECYY